jgi:hypothetical protein
MSNIAIIQPAITQLVAEARELFEASKAADEAVTITEKKLEAARDIARGRRIELGMFLRRARTQLPDRGTNTNGWVAFLEAIEMSRSSAHRYMEEAGAVSNLTGFQSSQVEHSEPADVPPPTDDDAPPEIVNETGASADEPKPNRDAYCTPEPIAKALPKKLGTDPCSNPHSIVVARNVYMLERGEDGLVLPWIDLTYVNGPFSNLLPFAEKLDVEMSKTKPQRTITGAGFMVNADHSPAWWHALTKHLHLRLDFDARLQFKAPPGVVPSKNDRPQTLLMDQAFWAACDQRALLEMGTLWKQLKA